MALPGWEPKSRCRFFVNSQVEKEAPPGAGEDTRLLGGGTLGDSAVPDWHLEGEPSMSSGRGCSQGRGMPCLWGVTHPHSCLGSSYHPPARPTEPPHLQLQQCQDRPARNRETGGGGQKFFQRLKNQHEKYFHPVSFKIEQLFFFPPPIL